MGIIQGNLYVADYFNKLKRCWDELKFLTGIPACTCGGLAKCSCKIMDRIRELESRDRLM